MHLLITGGAGFIGSHFVDHILEKYPDYQITNLDALTYAGSMDNLKVANKNPRHRFVHGSIEDAELIDKLVPDVDTIVNFAAESHVDRSISGAAAFISTNIQGTQVLLDAAIRHKTKLFYQISTDEVYGPSRLDAEEKFTESGLLNPSSPYAASKTAADLLVLAYHRTHGLPFVISRCTNNYGPRQHPEKLLPKVILNTLNEENIPVYGNGMNKRDWIYVKDHCAAVDMIMHRGKSGEIYNVAANNEWANIDLVKKIIRLMGKSEKLIKFVTDRPGHDERYAIDATKIKRELGWNIEKPWEEGLQELINWYTKNNSGYYEQ